MALGARASDIVSMVLRSLRSCSRSWGVVRWAWPIAYAAGRSMEALLAGVKPADAVTLISAVALSALMTIIGFLAPTLRAMRVDPITALRAD